MKSISSPDPEPLMHACSVVLHGGVTPGNARFVAPAATGKPNVVMKASQATLPTIIEVPGRGDPASTLRGEIDVRNELGSMTRPPTG